MSRSVSGMFGMISHVFTAVEHASNNSVYYGVCCLRCYNGLETVGCFKLHKESGQIDTCLTWMIVHGGERETYQKEKKRTRKRNVPERKTYQKTWAPPHFCRTFRQGAEHSVFWRHTDWQRASQYPAIRRRGLVLR